MRRLRRPGWPPRQALGRRDPGAGLATWRCRGSRSGARGRILSLCRWLSRSCSSLLAGLPLLASARPSAGKCFRPADFTLPGWLADRGHGAPDPSSGRPGHARFDLAVHYFRAPHDLRAEVSEIAEDTALTSTDVIL